MFVSTLIHKSKKALGFSLGLVFIFYVLNVLSELSTKVEFLKYFSIYTLADTRNVITEIRINPLNILISFVITTILLIATYVNYDKKELI